MNRIEKKFIELKAADKKAFIAFITAGYPTVAITEKLVIEFVQSGVDIIELGVPFSDPMADGPLIQEASQMALNNNVHLDTIIALVKRIRTRTEVPLCLMTYYNPIFCFGEDNFVKEAHGAGVDGVIIPDLPPEEAHSFIAAARKNNLDTIFFLAPTSPLQRIKLVSRVSRGFIYYVSLTGVTGARDRLPSDFAQRLALIKKYTGKPVCVGFGISKPQHVRHASKVADGVIVGSALIGKIKENSHKPDLVKRVGTFVRHLKGENAS